MTQNYLVIDQLFQILDTNSSNIIEEPICKNVVLDILKEIENILVEEPNVLELKGPFIIVGDIHGYFENLANIFAYHGFPPHSSYLFLGDYIDRGPKGLSIILFLFLLKIIFPNHIYLLRGNHETRYGCPGWGEFFHLLNIQFHFAPFCTSLYEKFMICFDYLPLAAHLHTPKGTYFCVHGGISPHLTHSNELLSLKRFSEPMVPGLIFDLLWSDPISPYQDVISPMSPPPPSPSKNIFSLPHQFNIDFSQLFSTSSFTQVAKIKLAPPESDKTIYQSPESSHNSSIFSSPVPIYAKPRPIVLSGNNSELNNVENEKNQDDYPFVICHSPSKFAPSSEFRTTGYEKSPRGENSKRFGFKVVAEFLNKSNLKGIIRGHQDIEGGYSWDFFYNKDIDELYNVMILHSAASQYNRGAFATINSEVPHDNISRFIQQLSTQVTTEMISPFLEMGFEESRARKALLLNLLNIPRAMEYLCDHIDDPDIDTPLTTQELQGIILEYGLILDQPITQSITSCIDNGMCTFTVTGPHYASQDFYHCYTCNLINGQGICVSCAFNCHRLHNLSDCLHSNSFYCDCGVGDGPSQCKCLDSPPDSNNPNNPNMSDQSNSNPPLS